MIFIFLAGGFLLMAAAYLLLRGSGILYKLSSSKNKWLEYDA